jgi:hypothetical protein
LFTFRVPRSGRSRMIQQGARLDCNSDGGGRIEPNNYLR